MGLDLNIEGYSSPNSKIGSYGGFNEFRKTWAKHLGFDLYKMVGFGGEKEWTNEPLQFFFHHSDCDGKISPQEAKQLLEQARIDFPALEKDYQCSYSFPILIEFCEKSISLNEDIEFC